jgi:hypothetical protein
MSYYTDRWVLFKGEGTWGTWSTPNTFPNYLMDWSATTTENKVEEDLIGGSRDYRKRVWLEEGVAAKWTEEMVSAKIFEYILGGRSGTLGVGAATYSPAATLPSMSIYRGLAPDESNNTLSLGYLGMKVDTADLTIEQSGDVKLDLNFAGKGVTIPTQIAKGTLDMTQVAYAFHNSSLNIVSPGPTTTVLDNVAKIVISVNNNLSARYSAGANTYKAVELREGAMEVTGRIAIGGDITPMSSIVTNRQDCTLNLTLARSNATITFTLKNVSFGELPDDLTGLKPVELDLPFSARPASGLDAISVVETNTTANSLVPY